MKIAIIPARGGSRRIPRKNVKLFFGRPIIAWPIEIAREAGCFDRIIVSTDDKEIAKIAEKYGAEVPFTRPSSISDDYSTTIAVVAHAIRLLQELGEKIYFVCCIYATAPFIRAVDLEKSLEIIQNEGVDYCFSVTDYSFPIQRSIRITKDNRCEMFEPDVFHNRSQDLEKAYHDAGQFYWGRVDAWIEQKALFYSNSTPYVLPRYRVQDIDTVDDWKRAELMAQYLLQ